MLAYCVSPPSGGTSRADRSEARAGIRLKELSLCHIWLPALKRFRLSPRGISRSSASTFERLEISGSVRAWLAMLRMVVSSGPKRSLKAICSWSLEALPAEEQHGMLVERLDDLPEGRIVDARDVDVEHLDAEPGV